MCARRNTIGDGSPEAAWMNTDPRYPELARELSGPIYLVPQYRQQDYLDQRQMLWETYAQLSLARFEKHSARSAKAITVEVFSLLASLHWLSTGKINALFWSVS